jgi:hypothetical protein
MSSAKKRSSNAAVENAALNYIRDITNREHHIFRRVFEEDVGIDAHIELCPTPDEPSGSVVALQVKSGDSYIHAETESTFAFYPALEDLQYWQSFALPVYLVVYHSGRGTAYWLDVKEACAGGQFEDMLAGVMPKKLIFQKSNLFSETFFPRVLRAADLEQQRLYNEFLSDGFAPEIDKSGPTPPPHIRRLLRRLDSATAAALLRFVGSRRKECAALMSGDNQHDAEDAEDYIREITLALRSRVFEAEGTGFVLMAFENAEARDAAAGEIESIVPANRYLVLKGRRLFTHQFVMNDMLLVAFDEWQVNEERFSTTWTPIKNHLGLTLGTSYDLDFYDPHAAATFFTPNYCFQYIFESFVDSGHELSLFDWCRISARTPKSSEPADTHLWVSVGPDRVKAYLEWDPAIYWYLHCVRAIRTGESWLSHYSYMLELEFDVTGDQARNDFIRQVNSAECLDQLPFMTQRMKEGIEEGARWGEQHYRNEPADPKG